MNGPGSAGGSSPSGNLGAGTNPVGGGVLGDDAGGDPPATGEDGGGAPQLIVLPTHLFLTDAQPLGTTGLQVVNAGEQTFAVSSNQPWLSATPQSGSNSGETDIISVRAAPAGLAPGQYSGELTATTGSGLSDTVIVMLTVGADYPPLDADAPHVSGRIVAAGVGLADVLIYASNGGGVTVSDEQGLFSFQTPQGWSGELTPRDANYGFDPPTISFSGVDSDTSGADFEAERTAPKVPQFGVRVAATGVMQRYIGSQPDGKTGTDFEYVETFDDAIAHAELRWMGDDQWKLTLTAKVPVSEIWFPVEVEEQTLNGDSSDDIFYTTRGCGDVWLSDALTTSFHGPLYPGAAFAPLVVLSDNMDARMVAAVNWPPRTVHVLYARGVMGLMYRDATDAGYNEVPGVGETLTYGLMQTEASGDASAGVYAWQRTVDKYKSWMTANGEAAGLLPVPYSDWMREIHGWMEMHMESIPTASFDREYVESRWNTWKHLFPWLQMWGQMSDYDPVDGCCGPGPEIHPRFLPDLADFAEDATLEGHVGFYESVGEPYPPIDGSTPGSDAYRQALLDWMDYDEAHGADAHYIDVFGVSFYGDTLTIANYFLDLFPPNTVIEYPVDLYPTAYYIGNCIYSNGTVPAGPGYTDCPDCLDEEHDRVMFPRFGRYLLDDRIMFLGTGGGGQYLWGVNHDYWQERQVFLLGAKIDVHLGFIEEPADSGMMNPALAMIISERDRTNWWGRWPKYQDRKGLRNVPPGIDVRRFVDKNGVTLFAIDNWWKQADQSFICDGQTVNIPPDQLSIIELP